jgi:DNA-binding CsgD family transcriptional regulator
MAPPRTSEAARRQSAERIVRLSRDTADERAVRAEVLEEMRRTVGFDAYAWLLTDPETAVGSAPLADVPCLPELPRLIRLKYTTEINRWTRLKAPVACLQAATGSRPERSLVWRELLSGYGVTDVASVVFKDRFGYWGFLDLWRIGVGRVFSDSEARYLAEITPNITRALRRAQAQTFEALQPGRAPEGPVVLVLSPDLEVKTQSADTEAYLRALLPPDGARPPVPAGAYNAGAQLLAIEAGVDQHPPRALVHLETGIWLTIRAARMAGLEDAQRDIAVTMERATGSERLSLFCRAYGLSRRQTDLVAGVVRGCDTRQLAEELFISDNTVQDHLKSIFAKTGTRSRQALMARAVGG